jgi:predicted ester cyclase
MHEPVVAAAEETGPGPHDPADGPPDRPARLAHPAQPDAGEPAFSTPRGDVLGRARQPQADPLGGSRMTLTMPSDLAISVTAKPGTDVILSADQGERKQPMRGYDDTYVDIVDFIIRVTHRIWEEKDIGHIYDTYRHNCRVTDDSGLQYGRDKIVADTVHTINAFPDVRLYADEVIWAGDEDRGFETSHRTVIVGHNTGHSKYGPPTGRKVVVWAIANCSSRENEFYEEWVLYNHSSLLRQLGFDLRSLARELGNAAPADALGDARFGEAERLLGQGKPERLEFGDDVEGLVRGVWHEVFNWRNLSAIDRAYAPNVRWLGPTDRQLQGRGDLKSFALSLLATFPDLAISVDDVYWMGNADEGYLVSVRWSGIGTHRGHGVYGPPTGRRVALWGLSQYRVENGRIAQEWTLFNEFDLLQQILRDDPYAGAA